MESSLQDKICLITGANKGIGYEIARQLCEKGFTVVITARNNNRGKEAFQKLREYNYNVHFITMDVADDDSIYAAADEFGRKFNALDVLINNAAILLDNSSNVFDTGRNDLIETLQTNTAGVLSVTRAFIKFMPRFSSIINISSSAGLLKGMSAYAPAYSISKAALNALTIQMAESLHKNKISVNAVCPGWVRTDMGGKSATRSVEKGAETAVWLVTDAPNDLTGKFVKDKRVIDW